MSGKLAKTTLVVVLITAASRTNGQEPGKKDNKPGKDRGVTSELEQLSERWYQAWLERDAAAVERMMADDYVYVAPTGQSQSREAILRIVRSPSYRLSRWRRTNTVVRMLGDGAAVIRCRGQGQGEFDGKHFDDDHALVQVWARIRGEWKVVVEQATVNTP
jgi:uncharacterized protein (TIGR02246 family)